MSEPQKFDSRCLTREDNMEAMRLQNELISHLWVNLNNVERELYTKIIDDPRNVHVNNIIILAFSVGLTLQLKRLQSHINSVVNNNITAEKIIFRMSIMVMGLAVAVIGLLGYIIAF